MPFQLCYTFNWQFQTVPGHFQNCATRLRTTTAKIRLQAI